jgi:subtilisin family serine protease
MAMTKSQRRRITTGVRYVVLSLWGLMAFFPIYWIVSTSFKIDTQWFAWPPYYFPSPPTLANYMNVWFGAEEYTQTQYAISSQKPLISLYNSTVIAVTSTDASDQLPAFANRGRYVAVAAPGVDLMLLALNGSLQFSSGTSFSAAYVSGTAALMLERRPDLGPDTLRQALTGTAHHLVSKGTEKAAEESGAGLVDAYQAVLSLTPAPVDAANALPAAAVRR